MPNQFVKSMKLFSTEITFLPLLHVLCHVFTQINSGATFVLAFVAGVERSINRWVSAFHMHLQSTSRPKLLFAKCATIILLVFMDNLDVVLQAGPTQEDLRAEMAS